MKTITHEEILNEFIGEKGTLEREAFENKLKREVLAYKFKQLRKKKHLSQMQLGEKAGLKKSQIARIENGKADLTFSNMLKMANALDAKLNFDLQPIEDL